MQHTHDQQSLNWQIVSIDISNHKSYLHTNCHMSDNKKRYNFGMRDDKIGNFGLLRLACKVNVAISNYDTTSITLMEFSALLIFLDQKLRSN